ncbi:MAG: radical SAM protein [Pseudomonadota bacterium]
MAVNYAIPRGASTKKSGLILTFIIPARKCNLNCPFCVVKQRKEALQHVLSVSDYVSFIDDLVVDDSVSAISIQGYEPLLPESWAYTKAIMEAARDYELPRSFITNGTYLAEKADDVLALNVTGISVSIDSGEAQHHDKLRGLQGAFQQTLNGLETIMRKDSTFSEKITVSSVLIPGRRHLLQNLPERLSDLGIKMWSLSPLIKIGKQKVGGPVGDNQQIFEDVLYLREWAAKYNISFALDDELHSLSQDGFSQDNVDFSELAIRTLERPEGLVRLGPDGACSLGSDVLREVGAHSFIWQRDKILPSKFLKLIQDEKYNMNTQAA